MKNYYLFIAFAMVENLSTDVVRVVARSSLLPFFNDMIHRLSRMLTGQYFQIIKTYLNCAAFINRMRTAGNKLLVSHSELLLFCLVSS